MSNLPSLIAIEAEIQDITTAIIESNGEITPEQEVKLSELMLHSKSKVSSYIHILDRLEAEAEFVEKNIKKAQEYLKQVKMKSKYLEGLALKVIEMKGGKLEGENGQWIGSRKSQRLVIEDESKINPVYFRIVSEVDKERIKSDIKAGSKVEGAHIEENTTLNWK